MFRFSLAHAALVTALFCSCSDDDSSSEGGGGSGAGAPSGAGDAGTGSLGGNAGSAIGSGGSAGGAATYSVADACERFAEVTCDRGEACGLLIPAVVPICLQCSAFALQTIAGSCESSLTEPPNAADVDRCLASIAASSCSSNCAGEPFSGCEAFDELPDTGALVECDPMCLAE